MYFFDDDICFCANPEHCPHKDECARAKSVKGIHTYSLFYDEDKDEDCEYFIKKKEENKNA